MVLADHLGDLCQIRLQLDRVHNRYHKMGSIMVRSPFWNYLALNTAQETECLIMSPIDPPNDYIESSVGKCTSQIQTFDEAKKVFF